MKKIYQNPEITVVMIQTAQMIAVSPGMYGEDAQGPGMSRESDWDEE